MNTRTWMRLSALSLMSLMSLIMVASPSLTAVAAPPPGMPDPSKMSGIPRPEPKNPAGMVTVRCLIGGFANPAVGVEVELEVATADGPVVLKQTTVEAGRATFEGLERYMGASVVAKATIAGQAMSSQAFVIGDEMGIALLLVATEGAVADPHGGQGQPADPHGGQGEVPIPGEPFPLDGRPRGTLIVGALDVGRDADGTPTGGGLGPIPNIEITLTATAPGVAAPIVEKLTTDEQGRAIFEGLDARLPEGSAIVVEGVLAAGEDPSRSQSFTLGETAYAVILARGSFGPAPGSDGATPPPPPADHPPGQQRLQLPGPRADKSIGPGQVRVFVIDGTDHPVADQLIMIHSSDPSGGSSEQIGRTDAQGMVIVDEVPNDNPEMLAQVRVVYQGAPYSSPLFSMPASQGALVILRVFKPTGDRSKVRSALQIDVTPRENDFASVSFNYAVFVEGDEAFWVPGGIRMFGPEGTRSLQVFQEAEAYLVHDGETPWVDLDRPLEPGVEVRLSFAAGVEHDGSLELDWTTPFPLVDEASVVVVPEELSVSKGVAGAPEINPHAGQDGEAIEIYKLGHERFEPGVCDVLARNGFGCPTEHWRGNDISVVIEGLPIRSRVWWWISWSLLGLTTLGVGLGVVTRRRVDPREALLLRRDALMAELVELDERGIDTPEVRQNRARMLRALNRIYRQLEVV